MSTEPEFLGFGGLSDAQRSTMYVPADDEGVAGTLGGSGDATEPGIVPTDDDLTDELPGGPTHELSNPGEVDELAALDEALASLDDDESDDDSDDDDEESSDQNGE